MRHLQTVLAVSAVLGHLWAAAPGRAAEPPRRPDFELPEVKVAKADLERLQGTYASTEMNMALQADVVGDRLRLSITEGPSFPPALLVPTSLTRFRWEGTGMAPGLAVVFQVTGGRAAALTVLQPGKPALVMQRASGLGWKPSLLALAGVAASIGLILALRRFRKSPAEPSRIFA